MTAKPAFYVDVWLDLGCPFSYIQLPVLDMLRITYGASAELRWHAFEVSPEPLPMFEPREERVLKAYEEIILPLARERGVTIRIPPIIARTRRAFEAAFSARSAGKFEQMYRAIQQAYFERGINLGSIDALIAVGAQCGLEPEAVRAALERGEFTAEVIADRASADRIGVKGLPFVLISRHGHDHADSPLLAVHGVAPFDHYRAAVDQLYPTGVPPQAVG